MSRGFVDHPVTLDQGSAGKAVGHDGDGEMRAFARAGMAGMGCAVIADAKVNRSQRLLQQLVQAAGDHGCACDWARRYSQAVWARLNRNITPKRPKALIFTQSASLTL